MGDLDQAIGICIWKVRKAALLDTKFLNLMFCFRRPFGKDNEKFDYEYDSEEDWEEEEEGESLSNTEDDEDDKEEEMDDYEVDNEFFVPHGYLSDGEEANNDDQVLNPETVKEKLEHAEKEFKKEHGIKIQEMKPRLSGVCFEGEMLDTEVVFSELGGFKGILVGNNNCIESGLNKSGRKPAICISAGLCIFPL